MSAENVAVVQGIYESFGQRDIPSVLAALDPAIEWVEADYDYLPHGGTHHGPDAVVEKVFSMVMSLFDEFTIVPEQFHDAGDVVVVEGRHLGKTKSGYALDAPAAWVWTVRDGKAVRNRNYHDLDAWKAAVSN